MAQPPPPDSLKESLARRLLPIKGCCGTGCRKCNYGRWLKHRPRSWWVLWDEALKRMPPWLWGLLILASLMGGYALGSASRGA